MWAPAAHSRDGCSRDAALAIHGCWPLVVPCTVRRGEAGAVCTRVAGRSPLPCPTFPAYSGYSRQQSGPCIGCGEVICAPTFVRVARLRCPNLCLFSKPAQPQRALRASQPYRILARIPMPPGRTLWCEQAGSVPSIPQPKRTRSADGSTPYTGCSSIVHASQSLIRLAVAEPTPDGAAQRCVSPQNDLSAIRDGRRQRAIPAAASRPTEARR